MSTVAITHNNLYQEAKNSLDSKGAIYCGLNHKLFNGNNQTQSQIFVASAITKAICNVALGLQNHLYFDNLWLHNYTQTNQKEWGDLWEAVQNQNFNNVERDSNLDLTIRDFLKLAFAELGVEVEFSGKTQYEKGVIIDVDEELAQNLGLNLEFLKQGQTVVKQDNNFFNLTLPNIVSLQTSTTLGANANFNIQQLIGCLIQTQLQTINNINN